MKSQWFKAKRGNLPQTASSSPSFKIFANARRAGKTTTAQQIAIEIGKRKYGNDLFRGYVESHLIETSKLGKLLYD